MFRMRRMMMRRLPAEYQEVEYLESTGVQWIDTGIHLTVPTDFELKVLWLQTSGQSIPWKRMWGLANSAGNSKYQNEHYSGISSTWQIGNNGTTQQLVIPPNTINTVVKQGLTYTVYDSTGTQTAQTTFTNGEYTNLNYSVYVLAGYDYISSTLVGRVYFCKFTQNSNIVGNFLPAYRISDHKPCMFDLVSQQPFFNQGTGTDFLLGPNVYA